MYIYTSNLVANFLVNNLWTAKWLSRYHPHAYHCHYRITLLSNTITVFLYLAVVTGSSGRLFQNSNSISQYLPCLGQLPYTQIKMLKVRHRGGGSPCPARGSASLRAAAAITLFLCWSTVVLAGPCSPSAGHIHIQSTHDMSTTR